MANSPYWGIDLGGTKIEVAVIDPGSLKPITRLRQPTEAHLGYQHVLDQIKKTLELAERESGLSRGQQIGICTPGALDIETKLLRNSNTTCLIGKPLKTDLDQLLGVQTTLANDANCFALAEAMLGAGKASSVVFGVIMGTGVGGGIVVHRSVLDGLNGIAGEWGHNVLDPKGTPCYCGKTGCVETVLSGPGISKRHQLQTGEQLSLEVLNSKAMQGDESCRETLQQTYQWFGKALSVVVNILDPEMIVLGGGVSSLPGFYTEGVLALHQFTFHDSPKTKVVKASLGDSAGVFGAALLCQRS